MSSRRMAKVAEAVRESVSTTVLFHLKDPRVKNVTVIRAEVSPDLRYAKVYVSIRGDAKTQSLTMKGLNSARGFIQSQLADRLQTRYTPVLTFLLDAGLLRTAETAALLREVLPDGGTATESTALVGEGDEAAVAEPDEFVERDEFAEGDGFSSGEEFAEAEEFDDDPSGKNGAAGS